MAVDYLLGERDAAGKPRDGVEVRRGDPDMVAAVADTPKFEHKYTSGVTAWAPKDRPTSAQAPQLSSAPSRANAVAASTPPMRRPATASSSRGPSTNEEKPSFLRGGQHALLPVVVPGLGGGRRQSIAARSST